MEVISEETRHKIGIDCLSLLEDDGIVMSEEDRYISKDAFFHIIRLLESEREKFIAICLYNGFQGQEIAFMLKIDPSRVTRNTQEMREKLAKALDIARK